MKTAVLYHSETGNTKRMAEAICRGLCMVDGMEARAFSIDEVDADYVKESCCVIMGSPTYYTDTSAKMKLFLENCRPYELAGKLGGAFATANFPYGGGEIALQTMQQHMMFWGMLIYSGGGACGAPPIHRGPVAVRNHYDEAEETFVLYGQRMAAKAKELFDR